MEPCKMSAHISHHELYLGDFLKLLEVGAEGYIGCLNAPEDLGEDYNHWDIQSSDEDTDRIKQLLYKTQWSPRVYSFEDKDGVRKILYNSTSYKVVRGLIKTINDLMAEYPPLKVRPYKRIVVSLYNVEIFKLSQEDKDNTIKLLSLVGA